MKLGITHPGQAHADDVLSAAVLIASGHVDQIERRDPLTTELADETVYVFDIGGEHDNSLRNFDHHQFERDAAPCCAFTLILKHLGYYDDWSLMFPWVRGIEEMDSKRPSGVIRRINSENDCDLSFETLAPFTSSPFAGFVLDMFAAQTSHLPGEPCFELLRKLGMNLIDKCALIRERWAHFDATTTVEWFNDLRVAIFDTTGPLGIETWLRRSDNQNVAVTISNDDRGDGLSVFRRNDHPGVDLSKCEHLDNVTFAHKNGFAAKLSDDQWREPLEQSLTS